VLTDKAERRKVFEILDQDRDGQISFKELQDGLLHGLKVPTNRAFVKRYVTTL
jgi:Ca2+-binding EF-hand superfamily protein